jgi:cytochrome c5
MSREEKVFRATCTSCHAVPNKKQFEKKKWRAFIERHGKENQLNQAEMEIIINFLSR